jgi:hypothetical protein
MILAEADLETYTVAKMKATRTNALAKKNLLFMAHTFL